MDTKIISHRTVEVTLTVADLMQLAGLDSDKRVRIDGATDRIRIVLVELEDE